MMKKIFFLAVLINSTLFASAFDFEVEGIQYNKVTDGVSIVGVSKSLPADYSINEIVSYEGIEYSVIAVEDNAFENHTEIISLTVPSNIFSLGMYAFAGCSSLKNIRFLDSEQAIKLYARPFDKCPIEELYLGRNRTYAYYLYFDNTPFRDCQTISKLSFGDNVTEISYDEFRNCSNLQVVEFGLNIYTIGRSAFSDCSGLKAIQLPESLKIIEQAAFMNTSLSSIIIPVNVENVGVNAFAKCKSLSKVIFHNSSAVIDEDAFYDDTNLEDIDLGNNIKSIGVLAFYNCKNLKVLTLPNSLTMLGRKAFCACKNITSVISKIEEPFEFIQDVFEQNVYDSAILYVPEGAQSKYQEIYCWRLFNNITEGQPAGINNITNKDTSKKDIYNLSGQKSNLNNQGIVIIQDSNGKTKKIVNR